MLKVFKKILMVSLILSALTFTGCMGGSLAWADNSVTKISGITVKLLSGENSKVFVLGSDSEERIARFGELGELPLITVKICGNVSKMQLESRTTPITMIGDSGHVTTLDEDVTYYTDYFKLKIRMPKQATKLNKLDGKGPTLIDMVASSQDGFYFENVEYIIGDNDKSNWTYIGDKETNDRYLYYGFTNDDNEIIAEYFVRVVYDITIEQ